ncbi:MAG TPA: glutaredoxin domain-containing protein [Polyangia bacterium]|nr:glutaredoxin domain-containing protein [Polyangia bacterium]
MRHAFRLACFTALLLAGACKRSAPESAPSPAPGAPATIEVLKDGRWLFTYAEPKGTFATTDKPESVPEDARGMVRVFDPSAPDKTGGGGRVYVTNLNDVLSKGRAPARPMSREAFETAALAAHPTGESSPLAAQSMRPAPMPAVDAGAAPPPPAGGPPVVTIYGTSWCGACRAARQYFTSRKIPFADKDIERDADAARELAGKAAKMGIPTDRVPVIDVRGRLLLGFDRQRIEMLLGEPT